MKHCCGAGGAEGGEKCVIAFPVGNKVKFVYDEKFKMTNLN